MVKSLAGTSRRYARLQRTGRPKLVHIAQLRLCVKSATAPETGEQLELDVKGVVNGRVKRVYCRRLIVTNPRRLAQAVHSENGGLLVLPESGSLTQQDALRSVLQEVDNPVLLIR